MNDLTNIPDRLRARAQDFLDEQPRAVNLRYEGKCVVCRRECLISWRDVDLLDAPNPPDGKEYCGHKCLYCGFANASTRSLGSK